jgi:hypothetical protein
MTQGALAQHIRPLLQSCNTASLMAFWQSAERHGWQTRRFSILKCPHFVEKSSFATLRPTGRAAVGELRPRMNSLTLLSLGLAIQIHDSERRGRKARDWRSSSRVVEDCWFSTAWSRSKIRLVRKKDGCVSLLSKRFCGSSLHSTRGFA